MSVQQAPAPADKGRDGGGDLYSRLRHRLTRGGAGRGSVQQAPTPADEGRGGEGGERRYQSAVIGFAACCEWPGDGRRRADRGESPTGTPPQTAVGGGGGGRRWGRHDTARPASQALSSVSIHRLIATD